MSGQQKNSAAQSAERTSSEHGISALRASTVQAYVLFVRHGQSTAQDPSRASQAHGEACLTPLGHEQAALAADAAAGHFERTFGAQQVDCVYASPFVRACETAVPFVRKFHGAAHRILPGVREFTYLSHERIAHLSGEERMREVTRYWEEGDPDDVDGRDAESFRSFRSRVLVSLAEIAIDLKFEEAKRTKTKTAIVIAHGWTMRMALWSVLQQEAVVDVNVMRRFRAFADTLRVPNTGFLPLMLHDGRWSAGAMAYDHVPEGKRTL